MKRKQEIKNESNFFLTDRALENATQDEFDHKSYAIILEKIIRDQTPPFNIGIYGKWGVGKSTIVNLLKERLKNDKKKKKIKFVEIKVWKYEKVSLRRKFIVKIASELNIPLDDIHQEMYADREFDTVLTNLDYIFRNVLQLKSWPIQLLIYTIFSFIILKIIGLFNITNETLSTILQLIENTLLILIFVEIPALYFKILKEAKFKLRIGKYDSDEQFEDKFIE